MKYGIKIRRSKDEKGAIKYIQKVLDWEELLEVFEWMKWVHVERAEYLIDFYVDGQISFQLRTNEDGLRFIKLYKEAA